MYQFKRVILTTASVFCVTILTGCDTTPDLNSPVIQEGLAAFRDQVRTEIQDNPVIVDKIGTIQSFELDVDTSDQLPGENDFAFKIKGPKGEGVLTATCITIDEFTEDVTAGTLKLSSGETVNLFP